MLTDRLCSSLKPKDNKPYKVSDSGGLYLFVSVTGTRSWRWKYRVHGKQQTLSLGIYPATKLGEARTARDDARKLLKSGIDPGAEKQKAKRAAIEQREHSLEQFATSYHAEIQPDFRNEKHGRQWLSSLRMHVFPRLGGHGIATINATDLLDLLRPLRKELPETAARLRQRLEAIFAEANVRGLRLGNPAADIRHSLKRKGFQKQHHRSLDYRDVPQFIQNLRQCDRVGEVTKAALEFLVLSAGRSAEVLGASWQEVDWQGEQWVIPAMRMKAGKEHRVPLGPRSLALLESVMPYSDTHCFPSPNDPNRQLSNMALLMALRRIPTGRKRDDGEAEVYADITSVHGMRSSFATWSRERTNIKDAIVESALAHGDENRVRDAYNRASYDKERRDLALMWEQFCVSPVAEATVIPIKSKRA
jgi:integrase